MILVTDHEPAGTRVAVPTIECVGCGEQAHGIDTGAYIAGPEGWIRHLVIGHERDELIAHCPNCSAPLRRILARLDHRSPDRRQHDPTS